jgi:hypothetical protein
MEWALMALHRGLCQLRCSTLYSEDAMQIRISPQQLSATIIAFSYIFIEVSLLCANSKAMSLFNSLTMLLCPKVKWARPPSLSVRNPTIRLIE